jgi:hypothetical protein
MIIIGNEDRELGEVPFQKTINVEKELQMQSAGNGI